MIKQKTSTFLINAIREGNSFHEVDYPKIAESTRRPLTDCEKLCSYFNLTTSPSDLKNVGDCQDLRLILSVLQPLNQKLKKYNGALKLRAQVVGKNLIVKDVQGDLERLVLEIKKQIAESQIFIVDLFARFVERQVATEKAKAAEKSRIKAAPKMEQSSKRKTLEWHRKQARKEAEKHGKGKS